MPPILELRKLVKHFPGHPAVREISLAIPRGDFFSLVGPSGRGKTTTLRLIACFEQPTSAEILLKGEIVNRLMPYERNVSAVFQNYALFPHLTARANVEFGLKRVYGYVPFMVLPSYAALKRLDPALMEAAADLGARPMTTIWRVVVPLSRPGIVAGLGAYLTPDLLGGGCTVMVGNLVQNQFTTARDWPFGAAVSIALMALVT